MKEDTQRNLMLFDSEWGRPTLVWCAVASAMARGRVTESRITTLTPASMPFLASLNKQTAVSRDSCASCSAAA
jgi:hypothetical protein